MSRKKSNKLFPKKKDKYLIKAQAKTDKHFGKKPTERSVKELLDNGLIKPFASI